MPVMPLSKKLEEKVAGVAVGDERHERDDDVEKLRAVRAQRLRGGRVHLGSRRYGGRVCPGRLTGRPLTGSRTTATGGGGVDLLEDAVPDGVHEPQRNAETQEAANPPVRRLRGELVGRALGQAGEQSAHQGRRVLRPPLRDFVEQDVQLAQRLKDVRFLERSRSSKTTMSFDSRPK